MSARIWGGQETLRPLASNLFFLGTWSWKQARCVKHTVVRGIWDLISIIGPQILGWECTRTHPYNIPSSQETFIFTSCFQSAKNITQWQTSNFRWLWNPLGFHSDFLNCSKIYILVKKDEKFWLTRKHSTASIPNLDLFKWRISEVLKEKISISSRNALLCWWEPKVVRSLTLNSYYFPLTRPDGQKLFYMCSAKSLQTTVTLTHLSPSILPIPSIPRTYFH